MKKQSVTPKLTEPPHPIPIPRDSRAHPLTSQRRSKRPPGRAHRALCAAWARPAPLRPRGGREPPPCRVVLSAPEFSCAAPRCCRLSRVASRAAQEEWGNGRLFPARVPWMPGEGWCEARGAGPGRHFAVQLRQREAPPPRGAPAPREAGRLRQGIAAVPAHPHSEKSALLPYL